MRLFRSWKTGAGARPTPSVCGIVQERYRRALPGNDAFDMTSANASVPVHRAKRFPSPNLQRILLDHNYYPLVGCHQLSRRTVFTPDKFLKVTQTILQLFNLIAHMTNFHVRLIYVVDCVCHDLGLANLIRRLREKIGGLCRFSQDTCSELARD